jgi:hypothetical protein
MSGRAETDLKAALHYHARVHPAAKIDLRFETIDRTETNRELLLRPQGREKFRAAYAHKPTTRAPFGQGSRDFIEDHYAWNNRRTGKMSRQAGMIGANQATNFKAHLVAIFTHRTRFINSAMPELVPLRRTLFP